MRKTARSKSVRVHIYALTSCGFRKTLYLISFRIDPTFTQCFLTAIRSRLKAEKYRPKVKRYRLKAERSRPKVKKYRSKQLTNDTFRLSDEIAKVPLAK